ncbi:CidA/LrgA family protein [Zhengella sp. ZM62]|uniref:CidA/LrgA family protein n=1 Tax=Zhengella sedimenti TaxID=3390035 RepID=UPI003975A262
MGHAEKKQPINLPAALAILLICQLAGEAVIAALRLRHPEFGFPGPVLGMGLLFLWLVWRGGPDENLDATAGVILRNLSLLFVPAAVGIIQYGDVMTRYGVVLLLALVVSTVLTLLVTVGVFLAFAKSEGGDPDE